MPGGETLLTPQQCLQNATRLLDEAEVTTDLHARETLTALANSWIDAARVYIDATP